MFGFSRTEKSTLVSRENALPDRAARMPVAPRHAVLGTPMDAPLSVGQEELQLGMGCFWGAERKLWEQPGVVTTAVGYSGGFTANPTYRDVCSGQTGHAETVRVVFDTRKTSLDALLRVFWESHDPTMGMRQGNDVGTQYRSAIYWSTPAQRDVVFASKAAYESALRSAGQGPVTTELKEAPPFFFAEDEHQQYLHKNPDGYCGLQGTGVACPAVRPAAATAG